MIQVSKMPNRIAPLTRWIYSTAVMNRPTSASSADARGVEIVGKARDGDERGGVHGQPGVLQADESDEQADADRNAALERQRDGVEDRFAHIGQRQHDKDQALDKDREQRDLPAVPVTGDDGVCHKGVQAHAGGQRKWQVCHKRHADRAEAGGKRSRQQDGGGIHAGRAEDARVDRKDVCHGHEGGDTRHDLGADGGVVVRKFEHLFKHVCFQPFFPFSFPLAYFPS
mgnify:CR=1 FL=1